jgi:large repetitive protein
MGSAAGIGRLDVSPCTWGRRMHRYFASKFATAVGVVRNWGRSGGSSSEPHGPFQKKAPQHRAASWLRLAWGRNLAILCISLGLVGPAWAVCPSPQTATVASGGSVTFTCSTFGFEFPIPTASHGTIIYGPTFSNHLTYTNNGDGALFDTFTAVNSDDSLTITFNITILPATSPITVSPATLPNPSVPTAYSQTLTASGGIAPYTFGLASGTLPPGLTLSSSGLISGTPTQSGPHTFTVSVTDSTPVTPLTTNKSYTVTVGAPVLDISPDTPTHGVISIPYNLTFTGSGGTAPYTFTIESGSLPPGLSMNSAGLVSGTPTATGSSTFSLRLDDSTTISSGGDHFIAQSVTITIDPPPTITVSPATLPAATVGSAYSQTISGGGGTAPYTFAITAGALPAGLTLNASTGALSGTPTAGGTFNFTVTATDSNSFTGSRAYTLTVNAPTISVAPATLPSATVGSAYSQTITASGGTAPSTFAITAGALPAGLSLSSGGNLSGTPTSGGTFNFTVTATDSSTGTGPFTGSRAYTLTVNAPTISVAPASLPGATQGSAYSQTVTASGGTVPYTFAITAGALPAGLSLSSGGSLSGTPTSSGTFNFTVTATDSSTGTGPFMGSRAYTLSVASAAPVANAVSATVSFNSGANPITLNITGGVPTSVAVATAAANGTATASGTSITYQPNTNFVGSDSFTYTASNAAGTSAPATVSITVTGPPLPIANAVSATVAHNSGANPITLNITGGTPTSVAVASAPSNGTAIASGTSITYQPNAGYAGPDSFTYTASNLSGTSAPATVSITVSAPAIVLSPATLPNGTAGTAYSQTLTASGGTAPYTFSLVSGALPIGMSLSSAGAFSGTPSASGTFNFTVRAADSNGFTGDQAYTVIVTSPTITVLPATLPDATAGIAYSQTFTGSGGAAPYAFSLVSGGLPVGMSMSSAGAFSGTPIVSGTFNFTVRATDLNGFTGDHAYSLVVTSPTITVLPATLPDATAGIAYSQTFTGSGGAAPYTFSLVSGGLPVGMSMSSAGAFSGTPIVAGTYNFTVRATDLNGFTGDHAYSVVVIAPTITIAPATLPNGTVGTAYSQALTGSGGAAPYTFSLVSGGLPPGMSMSSAGVFSGAPVLAGSYNFTVRATDLNGFTGDQAYTVVIGAAVPVAVNDTATTNAGSAVTIAVTANDSGTIASIALASAPVHGSAAVSGLSIVYTPNSGFFGSDSFTYTASGPGGTSNAATVSVTVSALPVPVGVPQTVTTLAGQPVTFDAATGATGSPFTGITLIATPASGTVQVSGTTITYTAPANASGAVTIGYTLNNAFGASAPITSTVNIDPLPIAMPHAVSVVAGLPVEINLTDGATGGPFQSAALVSVVPASAGTATIVASGAAGSQVYMLKFVPAAGFVGMVNVSYTLTNAFATSAPAVVSIDVIARPDPSQDAEVLGLLSAQNSAARRFAFGQIDNFQSRMEGLHGGAAGETFDNGITIAITRRCHDGRVQRPGERCEGEPLGGPATGAAAAAEPSVESQSHPGSTRAFWTAGNITFGDNDLRTGSSDDLDFETSGISAGVDYRLSPTFAIGSGIGYGRDTTDVGDNGSRSKGEASSLAVYASYHPAPAFYLDGLLGYQWLSFDTRRYINATGGLVHGDRDGTQWFGSLAASYEHRDERLTIAPYLRLDMARATLDAFTEQGDPINALHYDEQDSDTTTGNLGLRIEFRRPVSWGLFSPLLRLEYQHDFEDPGLATLGYADMLTGPFYRTRLPGLERNRFMLGVGAILQTERDWMLRAEYRGLFGQDDQSEQSIMLNFEKQF